MLTSRIRISLTLAVALSALALSASGASAFWVNSHWGGVGVVAGSHSQNLCSLESVSPGEHHAVLVHTNHARDAVTLHGPLYHGTLMCSTSGYILPLTAGPGPGHSLACPAHQIPVPGGAGYRNPGNALSQVHGGFGSGRDGYWHYKWYNQLLGPGSVDVQLWAVCLTD